jgi:predicted membrane protein
MKHQKGDGEIGFIIVIWLIAAWITHVITCLHDGQWGFLLAGAIMFPIAWINGTGIWFGVW